MKLLALAPAVLGLIGCAGSSLKTLDGATDAPATIDAAGPADGAPADLAPPADLAVTPPDAGDAAAPADLSAPAPDRPPANVPFVRNVVAGGQHHACAIDRQGYVGCWGDNTVSQLGNDYAEMSSHPSSVSSFLTFGAVTAGEMHSCALASAGKAYCWGAGPELGGGDIAGSVAPLPVVGDIAFRQLSAGRRYTCGVSADGTGYCWGVNASGELGNETSPASPARKPTPVAGDLVWKTINGGNSDHTCGVTLDGSAYCWGANGAGQLGTGMKGTIVPMPIPVATATRFAVVMPGGSFSCGLGADARIYCWGSNEAGELGNAMAGGEQLTPMPIASTESFKSLAVGSNFACGLTVAGAVLCWGDTFNGQLGRGIAQTRPPVAERATPARVMGNGTYLAIGAGSEHACGIVLPIGILRCWGLNMRNQVGDGTTMVRSVPVDAITAKSWAIE